MHNNTRSNKCRFSEEHLGTPLWAIEFLFFRAEGTRRKMTTRRRHLDSLESKCRLISKTLIFCIAGQPSQDFRMSFQSKLRGFRIASEKSSFTSRDLGGGGGFVPRRFPMVTSTIVIFFFPYNPNPPPQPDKPPGRPTPRELDFGPFRVCFSPFQVRLGSVFGSVWVRLGPFRVRFGVLGGVGVGSGRGASVREKEYHYSTTRFLT